MLIAALDPDSKTEAVRRQLDVPDEAADAFDKLPGAVFSPPAGLDPTLP
jgi:hypothetical protein